MTSRARKIEKNEVLKAVKDLTSKMSSFEQAVDNLKLLSESVEELDDKISAVEKENQLKIEKLNKDLVDNKIRTVNQAVAEMGKIVISVEELNELKNDNLKLKKEMNSNIEKYQKESQESFNTKLENLLKVQKLQHDCETAQLKAEVETNKKECENLRQSLTRMSDELNSQKQLTADIANVNRKESVKSN